MADDYNTATPDQIAKAQEVMAGTRQITASIENKPPVPQPALNPDVANMDTSQVRDWRDTAGKQLDSSERTTQTMQQNQERYQEQQQQRDIKPPGE